MSEKNSNANKNNNEDFKLHEDDENEEINPEELADQAGESVFQNIYKNVKSKIKDRIITKLLYKIERQEIKIHELETENKKLKDDLTYILKRILLNKTEFKNNNATIKDNLYNNKYYKLNNTISNNSTNNISSHKKTHTNITIDNNAYDISDIISEDVTPTKQNSSEYKIKKYLNNILKKNFVNHTDGTTTTHYIGKKINLYDELFPKNSLGNINSNNFSNVSNINSQTSINVGNDTTPRAKESSLKRDKSKESKKNLCLDLKNFKKAIIANYNYTDSASKDKKKKKIKIYQGGMSARKPKNNFSFIRKNNNIELNNNGNNKYIKVQYRKPNELNVLDSNDPNRKYKYNYYNCYYAIGCGSPRSPYLINKSSKKYM